MGMGGVEDHVLPGHAGLFFDLFRRGEEKRPGHILHIHVDEKGDGLSVGEGRTGGVKGIVNAVGCFPAPQ